MHYRHKKNIWKAKNPFQKFREILQMLQIQHSAINDAIKFNVKKSSILYCTQNKSSLSQYFRFRLCKSGLQCSDHAME